MANAKTKTVQDLIAAGWSIQAPGKSKGMRAGNPDLGGATTVQTIFIPKLRDGLHGVALMDLKTMQTALKAVRKVELSGELVLPAHEFERALAWIGAGRSNVKLAVEAGDRVFPGQEMFRVGPRNISWSKWDCAAFGTVLEAEIGEVEFLADNGSKISSKSGPAQIRIQVRFVIEAYDIADAKVRKVMKGMIQSLQAAETVVTVKGMPWSGMVAGTEGLVKLEDQAREGITVLETNVPVVVEKELDPTVTAIFRELYAGDPEVTFQGDSMTMMTTGFTATVAMAIESSTVAENVSKASLSLPQLMFLSAFKAGDKIVRRWLEKDLDKRVKALYYLMVAGSPINGGFDKPGIPKVVIGEDRLDVNFRVDATDEDILDAIKAAFPTGVTLEAEGERFYLRVDHLKPMLAMDAFGLTYIDTGSAVLGLIRGAMDPEMAVATGQNWSGMVRKVRNDLAARLNTQNGKLAASRIYGATVAVSAKVVFSDAIPLDEFHFSPYGGTAKYYADLFDCDIAELDGQYVYGLRDPGVVGGVYRIVLNPVCTPNTVMVNAARMRPENGGDGDGDGFKGGALTEEEALELIPEMADVLPKQDSVLGALGVSGNHPAFKMFGEKLKGVSTFDKMVDKTVNATLSDWLAANLGGARTAKELMPVAYSMMESMTILLALGKGSLHAVLLAAFVYEHRGLSGDDLFSPKHRAVCLLLEAFRGAAWHEDWASFADAKDPHNIIVSAMAEMTADTGVPLVDVVMKTPGVKDTLRILPRGAELNKLKNNHVYNSPNPYEPDLEFAYGDILPIYHMLWCLDRRRFGSAGKAALVLTAVANDAGETFIDVAGKAQGITETFAFHVAKTTAMWVARAISDAGGDPLVAGWYAIESETFTDD